MAELEIVTERSGHVLDGGVVLAWCPTYKVMGKIRHLAQSVVVLVEWMPREYEGWAKLAGAYNVVTGEVMASGLSEAGLKALKAVSKATTAPPPAQQIEILFDIITRRAVRRARLDQRPDRTYPHPTAGAERGLDGHKIDIEVRTGGAIANHVQANSDWHRNLSDLIDP